MMLQMSESDTVMWFAWLPLVLAIGVPVIMGIVYALSGGARLQKQRLQLIEKTLERQDLSAAERQELVRSLAQGTPRNSRLFVTGWLGLLVGIAWLLTEPGHPNFTVAVILTALGFGLVTLPLAQREIDRRQTARS
jgi:hypothetical protein